MVRRDPELRRPRILQWLGAVGLEGGGRQEQGESSIHPKAWEWPDAETEWLIHKADVTKAHRRMRRSYGEVGGAGAGMFRQ